MTRKQKIVYIGATSDDEMEEQFDQCIELIEDRRGQSLNSEIRDKQLRKHKRKTATSLGGGDEHHLITIISNRGDINRPDSERSAIEWVEDIVDDGNADELIMATPSGKVTDAQTIFDLTREIGAVTIASKRITFRAGVELEDIHRMLAAIRDAQMTRDGDEILKQDWTGGRPPIGTEVDGGRLIRGDDYLDVRQTLQKVIFAGMSKSEAAREIGCARKTIGNTINDRADLFDIPRQ